MVVFRYRSLEAWRWWMDGVVPVGTLAVAGFKRGMSALLSQAVA
jgi:hypothetical protein